MKQFTLDLLSPGRRKTVVLGALMLLTEVVGAAGLFTGALTAELFVDLSKYNLLYGGGLLGGTNFLEHVTKMHKGPEA
jgi:hypothetical protein